MKNIVIIGSGSDLSKEFVQQIDKNEYKVYLISREESMDQNQNKLTVDDYENELNYLIKGHKSYFESKKKKFVGFCKK